MKLIVGFYIPQKILTFTKCHFVLSRLPVEWTMTLGWLRRGEVLVDTHLGVVFRGGLDFFMLVPVFQNWHIRTYLSLDFTVYFFFFFRSDSPTVEASVVLFSLETLIITVSAGAVAALVVGFVTGGHHHHQHHHCYWSSSRREICQMFHTTLSLFCHNHNHHQNHCWSSSSSIYPFTFYMLPS